MCYKAFTFYIYFNNYSNKATVSIFDHRSKTLCLQRKLTVSNIFGNKLKIGYCNYKYKHGLGSFSFSVQ